MLPYYTHPPAFWYLWCQGFLLSSRALALALWKPFHARASPLMLYQLGRCSSDIPSPEAIARFSELCPPELFIDIAEALVPPGKTRSSAIVRFQASVMQRTNRLGDWH